MVTLELMKAISAAFNSRDVDRIVAFFAEDGVFCLSRGSEPVGRTLKGRAVIRQVLADRFKQIPDDAVISDVEDWCFGIFVDGDDSLRVFHADEMLNCA